MGQGVTSGYLIVKTFERMYREYLKLRDEMKFPLPNDKVIYSIPWKGMPPEAYAKQYRGAARSPLFRWTDMDEEAFGGKNLVVEPEVFEREAHMTMGRLPPVGQNDPTLIASYDDVKRVFGLLETPAEREIIWARDTRADSTEAPNHLLLGYEPTWPFGGEEGFSALSDCLCFPVWHGTDPEGVLFREHHEKLNRHGLFDTPEAAKAFLDYYLSFDWTETGPYVITEVRAANERA